MLHSLKWTLIFIIKNVSLLSNCEKYIINEKSMNNQWTVNEDLMQN